MLTVNKDYKLIVNENYKLQVHSATSTKKYLYPKKSRFEIEQSEKNNLFYWVLQSTNGKCILKSLSGYKTLQFCLKNITPILQHGLDFNNYEVEAQNVKNGLFYILYNLDGKKIAVSGNHNSYALKSPKKSYNIAQCQQVPFNGTKKGILSVIENLKKIIEKDKKVLYFD